MMDKATFRRRRRAAPVRFLLALIAFLLLGAAIATPVQAAPAVSASAMVGSSGGPIVLGAPAAPAAQSGSSLSSPVVLGAWYNPCDWGAVIDAGCQIVKQGAITAAACTGGLFLTPTLCTNAAGELVGEVVDAVGAGVGAVQRMIVGAINEAALEAASWSTDFVLGYLLAGDNSISAPRLDPDNSYESQRPDGDVLQRPRVDPNWFVGQASLMRNIGIYLIGPLMMLVVMQAIIKGSLYFLLRSALILLPVAIIGSVVLVQMTDLMLAIADDMSVAVAGTVLDDPQYKEKMLDVFTRMHPGSMGLFNTMWVFIFVFGSIAIFIELLIRETGIYLAAFFLPLAFCALVWPSTSKWARRLVEVLLGLIFSKVFITAAFTLGVAGMTSQFEVQVPANATEEQKNQLYNEHGTASSAGMSAILILAAFAGAKIMMIQPGGEAATQNRVVNTRNAWGKGQAVGAGVGVARGKAAGALAKIGPSGVFKN